MTSRPGRFARTHHLDDLERRLAHLERRESHLERDLGRRLDLLETEVRDARLRVDVTQEALLLAEASRLIPKRPVVAIVEAPAAYGNLAALARTLTARLGAGAVAVLARDAASEQRWREEGVEAHAWTTAPGSGAAESWHLALTAAVSVYEHHDWWREPDRLVRRALLAGSAHVQMWHGSSSGWGKEVALLTTPRAPGMREFADVSTTSVGYAAFVCEPRSLPARTREFQFARHVPDVDFRMVGPLRRAMRAASDADGAPDEDASRPRVLVAPTYPESDRAAQVLSERVRAYARVAATSEAEVVLRFHPWTPQAVREAADGLTVLSNDLDVYDVIETFDVLLTDFSSLAADALLLGRRVVLDHADAAAYLAERSLRRDEAVLACCDIATGAEEAARLAVDPRSDTRHHLRLAHARARLDGLGAEPGENTLEALREMLDAVR